MAQTKKRPPRNEEPKPDHVCPVGFCPVGMFLTVTGNARPEAVEHLVAAGREFMLALTAVLNTRAEDLGRTSQIEKIELE
ncbi:MAG: hypothetical protein ACRDHM_00080 [Actinomycetota bacterium]